MPRTWKIKNGSHKNGVRHYEVDEDRTNTVPTLTNASARKAARKAPSDQIQFHFTRHATSCYNMKTYERGGPIRERVGAIGHLLSDGVPSLAYSGIINTIHLAEKNKNTPRFEMPEQGVYVSNLIRTWMTAVLLYAYDKDTIALRMSPHLREKGLEGNAAHPLTISVPKFVAFLEQIRHHEHYRGLREVTLWVEQHKSWTLLPITIPEKGPVTYDERSLCIIVDPLQLSFIQKSYTDVGDLDAFMKWVYRYPHMHDTKDRTPPTDIHVVTHSGLMKKYVQTYCKGYTMKDAPFDVDSYYRSGEDIDPSVNGMPIDGQNCWSFTTTCDKYKMTCGTPDVHQLIQSIQTGYPNPGKGAALDKEQRTERSLGENSLCLQTVAPVKCPKNGGSRKRARRSYRGHTRRR
jgi:hypothetical protein